MRKAKRRNWIATLALSTLAALSMGCGQKVEPESPRWTRFRGPGGMGVSPEADLPVYWAENGSGVRWVTEVPGPGVSSPIVDDWKVFMAGESEVDGEVDLKIVAVDLRSGDILWETSVVSRGREKFPARSVNNASSGPTPVTDGERIFAYFGSHLAALDFEGKVLWLQEIDPDYLSQAYYGAGSSLVLAGDKIIVFRDRETVKPDLAGWLAAYDKHTGKRLWRKKWDDTCCSYTTPILFEGEAGTEIVITQAGRVASFEAESGKRLWDRPHGVNQPVASPVYADDILCSASGAHGVKNAACWKLRINDKGNTRPEALWAGRKGINSIASPVLYNDLLFTITDQGVLYCFDPAKGRVLWSTRLERGAYSASLTAGDGKIYAFSRWGSSSVVAAEPSFQLLAQNSLPHKNVVATPAVADGCLLVRTDEYLMCVEGSEAPIPPETDVASPEAAAG